MTNGVVTVRKGPKITENEAKANRQAILYRIRKGLVEKAESEEMYKRQVEEDRDPFEMFYSKERLIQPPFMFSSLYKIYEESDMLQQCIDAMIQNVDGFGYQMQYLGTDQDKEKDKEGKAELEKCENFFDFANDEQSLLTIRKLMRQDYEVVGNGGFEIVRNKIGDPQMAFHLPFRRMRVSQIDREPTRVTVNIKREGKVIEIPMRKYFRKFCQLSITGQKLRWFKMFGDPRYLDAKTGEYTDTRPRDPASEVMHFKVPFGDSIYGIPKWIGSVLDLLGRRNAQYVNWDLFQSQGIPPMAVMVSGGVLTDESLEEIEALVTSLRGVGKWNKMLILESNPESQGLEDKGTAKIELKNLSEYRKEDQMFGNYLTNSERSTRHIWRLPDLYVGQSETFTHATARAAKLAAEEQIFVPERFTFDEIMNRQFLPSMRITKWKYQSKGPEMVGADEIAAGVGAFGTIGALSINHAIQLANASLGLQMSKYKEKWAEYPFPMVMALLNQALLKEVDVIAEKKEEPEGGGFGGMFGQNQEGKKPPFQLEGKKPGEKPGQKKIPEKIPSKKEDEHTKAVFDAVLQSGLFSEEELQLYKRLRTVQVALESKGLHDCI